MKKIFAQPWYRPDCAIMRQFGQNQNFPSLYNLSQLSWVFQGLPGNCLVTLVLQT